MFSYCTVLPTDQSDLIPLLVECCCVLECTKKATSRSRKYGVTTCSSSCLSTYSFRRSLHSLAELFPFHGLLLRQSIVANIRFNENEKQSLFNELRLINKSIVSIVQDKLGKDLSKLMELFIEPIVQNMDIGEYEREHWFGVGVLMVNLLIPDTNARENKSMLLVMDEYQKELLEQIKLLKRRENDDSQAIIIQSKLTLLSQVNTKLCHDAPVKLTFTFMMNHMNVISYKYPYLKSLLRSHYPEKFHVEKDRHFSEIDSKKDSPRSEKRKKEEVSERMNHLVEDSLDDIELREKQRSWCSKALDNACSECESMESFSQPGRAFVVDTTREESGTILKNCSYCLVRNVSWIISIARLSKEEKEKHFNRISTPLTQYGEDLL